MFWSILRLGTLLIYQYKWRGKARRLSNTRLMLKNGFGWLQSQTKSNLLRNEHIMTAECCKWILVCPKCYLFLITIKICGVHKLSITILWIMSRDNYSVKKGSPPASIIGRDNDCASVSQLSFSFWLFCSFSPVKLSLSGSNWILLGLLIIRCFQSRQIFCNSIFDRYGSSNATDISFISWMPAFSWPKASRKPNSTQRSVWLELPLKL